MNPQSRISLQELARKIGAAKSTVSMALRNDSRIALATRLRIQAAAAELGYCADADVSALMAQIQARGNRPYQANLALIPIVETRVGRVEVLGCKTRAQQLGYKIEIIRDHQSYADLLNLLEARGIQGVIFLGWPFREFPYDLERFRRICERFPSSVIAAKPEEFQLHAVLSDAFNAMRLAFSQLLALGYKRPALFLNRYLDSALDGSYMGAYLACQRLLAQGNRLAPFVTLEDPKKELLWIGKNRPDCILTHDSSLLRALRASGTVVPDEIAFVHLDLTEEQIADGVSGVNQNHGILGEAAVDMVVAQIHRSERGIPKHRKCVLINATWFAGNTTKRLD